MINYWKQVNNNVNYRNHQRWS